MKLSNREKNLLTISAIIILIVGVYFLIYTPIQDNYDSAKFQYDTTLTQLNVVNSQVISDEDMDSVVETYREKIHALESELPSVLHLEQIINLMFTHFENYDIIVNAISFDMIDTKDEVEVVDDGQMGIEKLQEPMSVEEILDEYENSRKIDEKFNIANTIEGEVNYDNIGYMAISMSFVSNYDTLKDVLTGIENLDLTAVLTNIAISKNIVTLDEDTQGEVEILEEDIDFNEVSVSLSLSIPFYYDNEKEKDYIFDYSFNMGEDYKERGPFEYEKIEEPLEIEDDIDTGDEPVDELSISPEFYVSLSSAASDLPAQSFSYYGLNNSELDLNSDKNEKYTLNLITDSGKYFFQYKNNVTAYPGASSYGELELKNDAIIVKVFSSNRVSKSDNAGMTLILNNETGKKVLFYVYYDDKEKPRFNVIVNKGNFDVIRN
jgi:hypothetical protein